MQVLIWVIILFVVYSLLVRRKQAVIFKKDHLTVRSSKLANLTFSKDEILGVHILTGNLPNNAVVLNSSLYFGPITKLWTGMQPDRIVFTTNSSAYVVYVEDCDKFIERYRNWKESN
ncbi:hypothetical protein [Ectobacillus sp. sgz5001026]|uniref:hypothetical protein n=1 Tax=Ectobacillus sp. sgz5001026 TaxID=3242473 RepID=UPI0036D4149A